MKPGWLGGDAVKLDGDAVKEECVIWVSVSRREVYVDRRAIGKRRQEEKEWSFAIVWMCDNARNYAFRKPPRQ